MAVRANDCSVCEKRVKYCEEVLDSCGNTVKSQAALIDALYEKTAIQARQIDGLQASLDDERAENNSILAKPEFTIPVGIILGIVAYSLLVK
jgi:hypothetical protein